MTYFLGAFLTNFFLLNYYFSSWTFYFFIRRKENENLNLAKLECAQTRDVRFFFGTPCSKKTELSVQIPNLR